MKVTEVINNYYSNGFKANITKEELLAFAREYLLINELKKSYDKGVENRKELGQEILTREKNLKNVMKILEIEMFSNNDNYLFSNNISDYQKAFDLLLNLSNSNDYALKVFNFEQLVPNSFKDGRRDALSSGDVWLLGEKEVLNCFEKLDSRSSLSFKELATNLINENHSLIMMPNSYYQSEILPDESRLYSDKKKFKVNGLMSELYCYTHNDSLGNSVEKLKKYIDVYGGDLTNIPIEVMEKRISELNSIKRSL